MPARSASLPTMKPVVFCSQTIGDAELAAALDEVRDLGAAGRIERAVVGDDADPKAADRGVAADRRRPVVGLELEELGAVDDARDHLAHVDRLLGVGAEQAEQVVAVVQRRRAVGPGARAAASRARRSARAPSRARSASSSATYSARPDTLACIVGAAERLVGRDLAGRRLQQRRPGEEGAGAAAHHDHVVGEAGHVGAARGRRAVHDRDHRQPGGREPRQVAEQRAAANELLDAVLEQVRAGRLDQVDERQPVLERDLLRAQQLLEALRLERAGVDAGVVGDDA